MNDVSKGSIQEALLEALASEEMSQKDASLILNINQGYVSMVKTGTNWKAIPDSVWDKLRAWVRTGSTLKAYLGSQMDEKPKPPKEEAKSAPAVSEDLTPEEELQNTFFHIKLQPKNEFYREAHERRFKMVKHEILVALNENDDLDPEWITEYHELYGILNNKQ